MIITQRMIFAAANALIEEMPMTFDAAGTLAQRMLLAAEAAEPTPSVACDIRAVDWWADGFLAGERSIFNGE